MAEEFILDNGATAPCKGYCGYPAAICTSVNDEIVHGIPSEKQILKDGDIISIDLCTLKNGLLAIRLTRFVWVMLPRNPPLKKTTKESLFKGIEQAVEGNRVGDVSNAIQSYCEAAGYGVVREMIGHGIGRNMHEAPEVPNYGRRGTGTLLRTGMTICIEPMITLGNRALRFDSDGWTTRTVDGKFAAHFEHAVAIRKGKADILSDFGIIENVLKNLN